MYLKAIDRLVYLRLSVLLKIYLLFFFLLFVYKRRRKTVLLVIILKELRSEETWNLLKDKK